MFTREGGGGLYTVTSQQGAKIKVRKGVARLSYETKRKIYIIKKVIFGKLRITVIHIGSGGTKKG